MIDTETMNDLKAFLDANHPAQRSRVTVTKDTKENPFHPYYIKKTPRGVHT